MHLMEEPISGRESPDVGRAKTRYRQSGWLFPLGIIFLLTNQILILGTRGGLQGIRGSYSSAENKTCPRSVPNEIRPISPTSRKLLGR